MNEGMMAKRRAETCSRK